MAKKKYRVSIGTSRIIMASSPEEAEELFNEEVNECQCENVSVEEVKTKRRLVPRR